MQRFVKARADRQGENNVPGVYDRQRNKFAGFVTAYTRDTMFVGNTPAVSDWEFEGLLYSPVSDYMSGAYSNLRVEEN